MSTILFGQAFQALFRHQWGPEHEAYVQHCLDEGRTLTGQTVEGDERHLFEAALGMGASQLDGVLRQIRRTQRIDALPQAPIWWATWHQRWEVGGGKHPKPDLTPAADWRWAMNALFPDQSGSERWASWLGCIGGDDPSLWDLFCLTLAAEALDTQPPAAQDWLNQFLHALGTQDTRFSMTLDQRGEAGQWLRHWEQSSHPARGWFHLGTAAFIHRVDMDLQAVVGQTQVNDGGWNQGESGRKMLGTHPQVCDLLPPAMLATWRAKRAGGLLQRSEQPRLRARD